MTDHPRHLSGHVRLDALGWVVPMPIDDVADFVAWTEAWQANHRVAEDVIGGVQVSTIFTGFGGLGPSGIAPFATMLFGDHPCAREDWRYETIHQARANHAALVWQLRAEARP